MERGLWSESRCRSAQVTSASVPDGVAAGALLGHADRRRRRPQGALMKAVLVVPAPGRFHDDWPRSACLRTYPAHADVPAQRHRLAHKGVHFGPYVCALLAVPAGHAVARVRMVSFGLRCSGGRHSPDCGGYNTVRVPCGPGAGKARRAVIARAGFAAQSQDTSVG
jgi:hypothetical protein